MNWSDCLGTFMRVVECKSFTKASELLEVPPSRISKHVNWLEDYLNTKLLIRTTRSVSVTPAGTDLYITGQKLLGEWESFCENINHSDESISGVIRLDTSQRYTQTLMPDMIKEFTELYPKVKIYHRDIDRVHNMNGSSTDVYIGVTAPSVSEAKLVKKELIKIPRCYMASKEYIAKYGEPMHPSELTQHHCIALGEIQRWEFNGQPYPINIAISSNSVRAMMEFVEKGVGIGCFAKYYVEHLQEGGLVQVLKEWSCPDALINLYYIKRKHMPKRVRLFISFIVKKINEHRRNYFKTKILSKLL